MFLLILACTSAPIAEPEPAPQPAEPSAGVVQPEPAPPPRAADERFVLASSLNLREAPEGASIGKLSINSPVSLVGEQATSSSSGAWVQVRAGNGKEGWVGGDYLGTEPLTVEEATARAKATGELSWWQRAAAIAPDRAVLEGLAAAYRAEGKAAQAEQVDRQLAWPRQLLLAWQPWNPRGPGTTVVEWSRAGYGRQLPATVPKAAWRRYGLEDGDVWWVLPSQGPAIEAQATRLTHDALNDCSGEWSRNLWLEHAPFPDGVVALAAWRGRPPASWNSTSEPGATRAEAEAAILGKVPLKGAVQVRIGPSGEDWVGFARVPNGQYGELGNELYDEVAVRWTPEGVEVGEVHTAAVDLRILGERDLVGSKQALRVQTDGCENAALDPEGLQVHSTLYRCCGC